MAVATSFELVVARVHRVLAWKWGQVPQYKKIKDIQTDILYFWCARRDLFAFCLRQNSGFVPSSRHEQQSTGLLHLIFQVPQLLCAKK